MYTSQKNKKKATRKYLTKAIVAMLRWGEALVLLSVRTPSRWKLIRALPSGGSIRQGELRLGMLIHGHMIQLVRCLGRQQTKGPGNHMCHLLQNLVRGLGNQGTSRHGGHMVGMMVDSLLAAALPSGESMRHLLQNLVRGPGNQETSKHGGHMVGMMVNSLLAAALHSGDSMRHHGDHMIGMMVNSLLAAALRSGDSIRHLLHNLV